MKLNELYTLTNGIFTDLQQLDVPWKDDNINTKLDIAYLGNQSGQKTISPLLRQFVNNGALSSADRATVASVIFALYGDNWLKLWNTLFYEYNPIENYHMIEEHTGTDTGLDTPNNWKKTTERTPDLTRTETQTPANWKTTETQTPTDWEKEISETFDNYHETETTTPEEKVLTETETFSDYHETSTQTPDNWEKTTETTGNQGDNTSKVTNKIVPINSQTALTASETESDVKSKVKESQGGTFETDLVKSGERSITKTDEGSVEVDKTITGSKTTTESQSGTYKTETATTGTFETETTEEGKDTVEETQTGTFERKTTYNTTLERSGNIGTLTTQQMIESEREIDMWNYFYKVVFPDVDKALTLAIY